MIITHVYMPLSFVVISQVEAMTSLADELFKEEFNSYDDDNVAALTWADVVRGTRSA